MESLPPVLAALQPVRQRLRDPRSWRNETAVKIHHSQKSVKLLHRCWSGMVVEWRRRRHGLQWVTHTTIWKVLSIEVLDGFMVFKMDTVRLYRNILFHCTINVRRFLSKLVTRKVIKD
jgi:hypothetical protein